MRFRGGGVGHKSARKATDYFLQDRFPNEFDGNDSESDMLPDEVDDDENLPQEKPSEAVQSVDDENDEEVTDDEEREDGDEGDEDDKEEGSDVADDDDVSDDGYAGL